MLLFGFSQGACAATSYAAAEGSPRLGGLIAMSGGLCGSDEDVKKVFVKKDMKGYAFLPAQRKMPTCQRARSNISKLFSECGAEVSLQLYEGSAHRIFEASASRARSLLAQEEARRRGAKLVRQERAIKIHEYLCGFKAHLLSEAIPNSVPRNQRSPRHVPQGLIAECVTGSPFCAPRGENLCTWLYRLHPSVGTHGAFRPLVHPTIQGDFCCPGGYFTPEPVRWFTPPEPKAEAEKRDFVESLTTLAGSGNPMSTKGLAIHTYSCNKDMVNRSFYNSDGDLLVIPELGGLMCRQSLAFFE